MIIWRSLSPLVLARVMELLMTRRAASAPGSAHEDRLPLPTRDEAAAMQPKT